MCYNDFTPALSVPDAARNRPGALGGRILRLPSGQEGSANHMLKKNDLIPLKIDSVVSDGNGLGRHEGMAVFVPMSAPGDMLTVRIVKVLRSYCYGIIHEILSPSPFRADPGCPVYKRCGGCALRHVSYDGELAIKREWVSDAFRRIGGLAVEPLPVLPSPVQEGYRNKAQYPIGKGADGKAFCGFFARRSHDIIPAEGCRLQPTEFSAAAQAVCRYIDQTGGDVYDELTGTGLFRPSPGKRQGAPASLSAGEFETQTIEIPLCRESEKSSVFI